MRGIEYMWDFVTINQRKLENIQIVSTEFLLERFLVSKTHPIQLLASARSTTLWNVLVASIFIGPFMQEYLVSETSTLNCIDWIYHQIQNENLVLRL